MFRDAESDRDFGSHPQFRPFGSNFGYVRFSWRQGRHTRREERMSEGEVDEGA